MEIFKDLPFDIQEIIYNKVIIEQKMETIQEIQKLFMKDVLEELERYQGVFWNEDQQRWSVDVLFFTLRYEMRMEQGFPSFIM